MDSVHAPGLDTERLELLRGALASRYEIVELSAAGGMAYVLRARDVKHGRPVALKVLRPELAEAVGVPRFLREIQIAAKLQHPSIVPLYDSGEAAGFLYFVMPFVEGESLDEKLRREGPLWLEETIDIAGEVAEALDYAHGEGVVHRDIKPSNIMLSGGRALLTDFGVAAALESDRTGRLTEDGSVLGTPSYMSPEQASGMRSVDRRSDVYSLGCVVYEMLAGQPPFSAASVPAVLARHVSDPVPPLRTVRPDVPLQVQAALERALAKVPDQRFAGAGAFIRRLESSATSKRRPPWLVPAVALGVGLLAALAWRLSRPDPPSKLGTPRRISSIFGYAIHPTWSPDKKHFAYAFAQEGNMDVFVARSDGTGATQRLTSHPADDVLPRWSPDGRNVAFLSNRDDRTAIYVIPSTGGDEDELVDTEINYHHRFWDAQRAMGSTPWSPSGEELLYSHEEPSGAIEVWKLDLETRERTRITSPAAGVYDLSASWSYDGEAVVFERHAKGLWSLWLLRDGKEEPLVEDVYVNCDPCWLPDGRGVLYCSNKTGALELWEIDVETGESVRLTSGDYDPARRIRDYWRPVVSPLGGVIYTDFNHRTDIYVLDVDQPLLPGRRLTQAIGDNFTPRFSPDGRIAYFSTRESPGTPDLRLLDPVTRRDTRLARTDWADIKPDWHPDGTRLAYYSDQDGLPRLWVMNVESRRSRLIAKLPVSREWAPGGGSLNEAPRWAPDGRTIAFLAPGEEGPTLYVVNADGGEPQPILTGLLRFDWYVDPDHIVYTRMNEDRRLAIFARELSTGREVELRVEPHAELIASRDGKALAYCRAVSHFNMDLYLLPMEPHPESGGLPRVKGEPVQLTDCQGKWHVHNGGFSHDGKQIAYTRDTDSGFVYVADEYP